MDIKSFIYRKIKKRIDAIYERHFRTHYTEVSIHSADVMLPRRNGPTAFQLLIVSRLIDVEELSAEKTAVYNSWGRELSEREVLDKSFSDYLDFLNSSGFDYSAFRPGLYTRDFCGISNDASHRWGYLLHNHPNFTVIAKPISRNYWGIYLGNGVEYYKSIGMDSDLIDRLVSRYNELIEEIRSRISAVVSRCDCDEICHAIKSSVEGVAEVDRVCELEYSDFPSEMQKNLSGQVNEYTLIHIRLRYQDLHFINGKLVSSIAEEISNTPGCWYVCSTIAESVLIDSAVMDIRANKMG